MKKRLFALFLCVTMLLPISGYSDKKPVIATENTTTPYQAKQFLKDRNTTKEMIDCVDFVYEYCEEVGIDATLIIAQSSIETGYGKSKLCRKYNNVGGMKASRGGWMRFNSLKDGYRAMINKIAVMAGVRKSSAYYFNSCYYIEDLGKIYWCENGCDYGYYDLLCKQMNSIKSYKKFVKKKVNKPKEIKVKKETTKKKDKVTIKAPPKKQSAKDYLMSFTKGKKKSGMNLIYGAIKK